MSANMTSPMLSGRSLVEVTIINVRRTLIGGELSENHIKGNASRLLFDWGRGVAAARVKLAKGKLRPKYCDTSSVRITVPSFFLEDFYSVCRVKLITID